MDSSKSEILYYRYCRDFNGRLAPVDFVRHNGRLVPRFHPSWKANTSTGEDETGSADYVELVSEISTGLTARQREIWLSLLDHSTISEVARIFQFTRQSVYDYIERMAKHNDYVAIWWRRRSH